jgi:hypothetical protein
MVVAFDIETTGLNPYDNKAIIVGIKEGEKIQLYKEWDADGETRMLLSSLEHLKRTRGTIVGFNNLKFDVPFIHGRLETLGHWQRDFWWLYSMKWFDLYQFQGDNYVSQASWLAKAGIQQSRPDLHGKDMPRLYKEGSYEEIEAHIVDDLRTSEALFQYLKKERPDLISFE